MLIVFRVLSVIFLIAVAVVVSTLWAKLIGKVLGGGGLILFVIAPLPVLGGVYLIGRWIDGKLARMANRKARDRNIHRNQYGR